MLKLHVVYIYQSGDYKEYIYPFERLDSEILLGFKFNNTDERWGTFTSLNNFDNIEDKLLIASSNEAEAMHKNIINYVVFDALIDQIYSIYD